MDKRGMALLPLIAYVFFAFFVVVFVGMGIYGLTIFDDAMTSVDITISGYNFTEVYEETTGLGVNAMIDLSDITATAILLGMIIIMMIVGYYWGDEKKKLWMILDLFIIIIAFVISVYLQGYFLDIIIGDEIIDPTIYTDILPKSSRLLAYLPYSVVIIGILIMIVTYSLAKRKSESVSYAGVGY